MKRKVWVGRFYVFFLDGCCVKKHCVFVNIGVSGGVRLSY